MSDALNITVNGLNNTSQRIAKSAASIVNASSTGAKTDSSSALVDLLAEKTSYAAEAKTVKVVEHTNKALLDILA